MSGQISRRERQIVRILALLRRLGEGASANVNELAAEFRTRRETIYRDLRVLQDAGYPIAGDERGRLSRPRLLSSRAPEIRFSRAQTEALLMALAQAQIALPNAQSLAGAAAKVKAIAQYRDVDGIFDTWICGSKDYRPHEERIVLLVEAILRRRRCSVTYQTPARTRPKTYDFDPYRLLFVGGGLYVVGRVPKHAGTATLAVDRFVSMELQTQTFELDPDFDPQQCRVNAFGVAWNDPTDVVLRFRSDEAPYVRERLWHPTQKLTELPEGAVELSFRAGGPFEIRRWILGWGDAVEVMAPEELRREIRDVLRSAASVYAA